jgi:hypothetical protein
MLNNALASLAQNRPIKFVLTFSSNHHANRRLSPGLHRRPGCCHSEAGDPRLRAAPSLHGRSVRRSSSSIRGHVYSGSTSIRGQEPIFNVYTSIRGQEPIFNVYSGSGAERLFGVRSRYLRLLTLYSLLFGVRSRYLTSIRGQEPNVYSGSGADKRLFGVRSRYLRLLTLYSLSPLPTVYSGSCLFGVRSRYLRLLTLYSLSDPLQPVISPY